MTYTLNEDNSHTLTYQSEVHTYSDDHVETTVTQQTINLSPEGEILSSNESKEVFQSAIIGETTVMNPLDGMVVTTPRVEGEKVLMSSSSKGDVPTCDLSCDAQDVVGLIQDRTKTNQRYDLFKENAAEYNFGSAVSMGALVLGTKAPGPVKFVAGVLTAGSAYMRSTQDNRGRTGSTLMKVKTKHD